MWTKECLDSSLFHFLPINNEVPIEVFPYLRDLHKNKNSRKPKLLLASPCEHNRSREHEFLFCGYVAFHVQKAVMKRGELEVPTHMLERTRLQEGYWLSMSVYPSQYCQYLSHQHTLIKIKFRMYAVSWLQYYRLSTVPQAWPFLSRKYNWDLQHNVAKYCAPAQVQTTNQVIFHYIPSPDTLDPQISQSTFLTHEPCSILVKLFWLNTPLHPQIH